MPRKIRDLVKDLRKADFIPMEGGKGSHRKLVHKVHRNVTAILPGKEGDDAKRYLEKQGLRMKRGWPGWATRVSPRQPRAAVGKSLTGSGRPGGGARERPAGL